MPTPLSSVIGTARRATYVLTASNASFPIPSWAQGGKGIVYVTGCGGGGGGSSGSVVGGGAAACAVNHPLIIQSGAASMGLVIGVGGANNTVGGSTEIAIGGVNRLRLSGGNVGNSSFPAFWNGSGWQSWSFAQNTDTPNGGSFFPATLAPGAAPNGATGGASLFGAGGSGGQNGLGFGAGAGDFNSTGSPGFLMLEFVEGQ